MRGLDNVLKNIEKASKAVDKARATALKAGALEIQNPAKVKAPHRTGNLRRSIHIEIESQRALIGTDVEYAKYQEYGTRKMKAHPYLRPAFDENIKKAREVMARVFQKMIFGR